jgi:hypothetical protein
MEVGDDSEMSHNLNHRGSSEIPGLNRPKPYLSICGVVKTIFTTPPHVELLSDGFEHQILSQKIPKFQVFQPTFVPGILFNGRIV